MGITQSIIIKMSPMVDFPMVMGSLKPVILIPLSLATKLSTQQLELVLAHELAHIQRQDYFWNGVQSVVESIYFFHPALWWLSAQIRKERESACDDIAMQFAEGPN